MVGEEKASGVFGVVILKLFISNFDQIIIIYVFVPPSPSIALLYSFPCLTNFYIYIYKMTTKIDD